MEPSEDPSTSSSVPYTPSFTSFGSPLTRGRGSLLSPAGGAHESSVQQPRQANASGVGLTPRGARLRARDLYGGPLMFGGTSAGTSSTATALRRANRLLVTTPYHRPAKATNPSTHNNTAPPQMRSSNTSASMVGNNTSFHNNSINASNGPASVSPSSASPMSSTAQTILDTLEKMSTPLKDAQKIPVPRAERRRAIAQELLKSGPTASSSRRRPRLGNVTFAERSASLSGPPLRKVFSPVSGQGKQRSPPTATLRSGTPKPVIVERRKTPRETMEEAAAEASLSSASGGGKLRAKVGEKAKGREMNKLDEDVEETPEYLTKSADNPFLNMKSMPNLAFSTPAVAASPEQTKKKASPAAAFTETPKSTKSAGPPSNSMFKAPANNFASGNSDSAKPSSATIPSFSSSTASKATSSFSPKIPTEQVHKPASKSKSDSTTSKSRKPSFDFRSPSGATGTPSKRPISDKKPDFSFRSPTPVKKAKSASSSTASSPTSSSSSSAVPSLGMFNNVVAPNVSPFTSATTLISSSTTSSSSQMMPDLTTSSGFGVNSGGMMSSANKLKTGSVMDILGRGSNHKLPDVTASTPSSTSATGGLKKGSVMDILGKSNAANDAVPSSWGSSFGSGKPWN